MHLLKTVVLFSAIGLSVFPAFADAAELYSKVFTSQTKSEISFDDTFTVSTDLWGPSSFEIVVALEKRKNVKNFEIFFNGKKLTSGYYRSFPMFFGRAGDKLIFSEKTAATLAGSNKIRVLLSTEGPVDFKIRFVK